MIYPTDEQLLAGIAAALKDTVLPDLARGSAARKQLQAAIETLRRMAFAAPERDAALAADNADMLSVLKQIAEILAEAGHSPPPNPPPSGGRAYEVEVEVEASLSEKRLPLEGGGRRVAPGGGDIAVWAVSENADPVALNRTLQQTLADLQNTIPPELSTQVTPMLTQLYTRMTDRALALIPPPMPRTPRKPE
jgi:hypothetical protein